MRVLENGEQLFVQLLVSLSRLHFLLVRRLRAQRRR
jgi:hypothetical protein